MIVELEVAFPDPVIETIVLNVGPAGADGEGVPAGGAAGQVLSKIDGTDYNTQWSEMGSGVSVIISDTPPPAPSSGDLWLDSTKTKLYIYYNDGDSSQWVSANSGIPNPNSKNGWMDYNNSGGSISISADTWTDLPNDGLGAFTNKAYKPAGVSEVVDTSTGYLDFSDLPLGSEIILRNDVTVNPNTNNALFQLRYVLGTGAGEYYLNFLSERLDSGSGIDYQRVVPFPIYMGDSNTQGNAGKLQAKLSTPGTINNAGVYASIRLS